MYSEEMRAYHQSDSAKHARIEAAKWKLVALLPYDYDVINLACDHFRYFRYDVDTSVALTYLYQCLDDFLVNGYRNEVSDTFMGYLQEAVKA